MVSRSRRARSGSLPSARYQRRSSSGSWRRAWPRSLSDRYLMTGVRAGRSMEDWLRARGWLGRYVGRPSWGRCAMTALLVDGHCHHRRSADRQRSGLRPCGRRQPRRHQVRPPCPLTSGGRGHCGRTNFSAAALNLGGRHRAWLVRRTGAPGVHHRGQVCGTLWSGWQEPRDGFGQAPGGV